MPKITRTQYGGVWPSMAAETNGTIYAAHAIDVDVSTLSIRPMRAPRRVATETGRTVFVDGCVLLLSETPVLFAHNSVGGDVLYRTGANGYPEVAYNYDPPPAVNNPISISGGAP